MKPVLKINTLEYWRLPILCIKSIRNFNTPDALCDELGVISVHLEESGIQSNVYYVEFSSNEKMMEFQLRYL